MNKTFDINFDKDDRGYFLKIKSNSDGKHFAVHRSFTKRLANGYEENVLIDESNKNILMESLQNKGITEGFILYADDGGNLSLYNDQLIDPNSIRHIITDKENNFTSTGEKLDHHWPIFQKLQETEFGSIIRATLTLHQVCASRCQFCSTINRNRKDSISLQEAKDFVEKLYYDQREYNRIHFPEYNDKYKRLTGSDIGLRGLILSGGGQPNLWPHFEEFVKWLKNLDLDIGLITNGFPKHVNDEIYNNFKWIRLSVTPEDASPFYPNGKFNLQRIPENIINSDTITFGLSYVYGPWTNDDILLRMNDTISKWNLGYVRFLTDCNLGRSEQLKSHNSLAERLHKLNMVNEDGMSQGKIFHQLKYHGTQQEANDLWNDGKCFLQAYNVFWDTTGHEVNGKSFCYPCDSVTVLAEDDSKNEAFRGFDGNKWGTVYNNEVSLLYKEKWKAFFDPRKNCSACLFMKNNATVKSYLNLSKEQFNQINPKENIVHVNFP